jgi:hypothetical protein
LTIHMKPPVVLGTTPGNRLPLFWSAGHANEIWG